ncbi:MAG: GGDEF domain-containing protein [Deltaproteobacteria bacterium]
MELYILMVINIILIIFVFVLLRKLEIFQKLKKNYAAVVVLQKIMEVLGKQITATEKLEKINNILVEENDVMYSTVVSSDGGKHNVLISNTGPDYYQVFEELLEYPVFKNNALKNVPKYITSEYGNYLKYPSAFERGICSCMFMPLYLNDTYVGYWLIEDKRVNAFDNLEKIQLSILKNDLVLIIENNNYQSTIEKMAVSDRLTGLYNRYFLYSKGKSVINEYPVSTVVMADIDHFKKINDTFGHDIGDKVLVNMVETTLKYLSQEDIFVRFGGEEFVILLPGRTAEDNKRKIDEIRELISGVKILVNNNDFLNVTVSYGMSTFRYGENFDAALKNADIALYKAKENGRNCVEIA